MTVEANQLLEVLEGLNKLYITVSLIVPSNPLVNKIFSSISMQLMVSLWILTFLKVSYENILVKKTIPLLPAERIVASSYVFFGAQTTTVNS